MRLDFAALGNRMRQPEPLKLAWTGSEGRTLGCCIKWISNVISSSCDSHTSNESTLLCLCVFVSLLLLASRFPRAKLSTLARHILGLDVLFGRLRRKQ